MAISASETIYSDLVFRPVVDGVDLGFGDLAFVDAETGDLTDTPNGGANRFAGITVSPGRSEAATRINLESEVTAPGLSELKIGDAIYTSDGVTLSASADGASYLGDLVEHRSGGRVAIWLNGNLPG